MHSIKVNDAEAFACADDDTLLSLLFVPGFSTRESSDLLAGRGLLTGVSERTAASVRLKSKWSGVSSACVP